MYYPLKGYYYEKGMISNISIKGALNYFLNKNCIYLRCTTWWFDIHIRSEVITVKQINIPFPYIITIFLCNEWKHLKSSLLAHFCYSVRIINCSHHAAQYIFRLILVTASLCPLTNISMFPYLPATHNHHSNFCFYVFQFFLHYTYK